VRAGQPAASIWASHWKPLGAAHKLAGAAGSWLDGGNGGEWMVRDDETGWRHGNGNQLPIAASVPRAPARGCRRAVAVQAARCDRGQRCMHACVQACMCCSMMGVGSTARAQKTTTTTTAAAAEGPLPPPSLCWLARSLNPPLTHSPTHVLAHRH